MIQIARQSTKVGAVTTDAVGGPRWRAAESDQAYTVVARALQQDARENGYRVAELVQPNAPRDSVVKLLVSDASDVPSSVVYLSPPSAPQLVSSCMAKMRDIQAALGSPLGEVILPTIAEGVFENRSFAAVPYCVPSGCGAGGIRSRLRRSLLGNTIGRWLHGAVEQTRVTPMDSEIAREFCTPLRWIANCRALSRELRDAAGNAEDRIERGAWAPVLALEHGDLWEGNVLQDSNPGKRSNGAAITGGGGVRQSRSAPPFVLVDWYGARLRGRPMYDLVRLAISFRFSRRKLAREARRQCQLLRSDELDAMGYLLASLGCIASQADHFPMARFVPMAQSCFCCLASAMGRP